MIKTMWMAKSDFIKLHQQPHQSVQDYYKKFLDMMDVNDTLNNNIHQDDGLINAIAMGKGKAVGMLTTNEKVTYLNLGRKQTLAIPFMYGSDRDCLGDAMTKCNHDYLKG